MVPVMLQAVGIGLMLILIIRTSSKRFIAATTAFLMTAVAVLLAAMGYLLELLGPSFAPGGMLLQMFGFSFAYPILFLSNLRTCGMAKSHWVRVAILLPPVVFALPAVVQFAGEMAQGDLLSQVMALHGFSAAQLCTLYGAFCALGSMCLHISQFIHPTANPRWHSAMSAATLALPLLALVLFHVGYTGAYNPMSFLVCLCLFIAGCLSQWQLEFNWVAEARSLAIEKAIDGYLLIDYSGRLVECNAKACAAFPSAAQNVGRLAALSEELDKLDRDTASLAPDEDLPIEAGGMRLFARQHPVHFGGRRVGHCILLRDTTAKALLEQHIQSIETVDEVTGQYNKRAWDAIVERDYRIARRHGTETCQLIFALDDMPALEAELGKAGCETVLHHTAKSLRNSLRTSDLMAHFGEGVFAILLPHSSREDALNIAEGLRHMVGTLPREAGGKRHYMTASIGIAALDSHRHTCATALLDEAMAALYTARQNGGNQCHIGGPPHRLVHMAPGMHQPGPWHAAARVDNPVPRRLQ